jgi:LPXTG-site transpeptidase (sortase) family protein
MKLPRFLRLASWASFAFGALCLGWVAYYHADAAMYQKEQSRLLDQVLGEDPVRDAHAAEAPVPQPQPRPTDPHLVGRIEIPRVGVSAVIHEGSDPTVLRRAVGHIPGTAAPGRFGNVGLAAHRQQHFRGLRNIREGDRISVVTTRGRFEYEVERTWVVKPSDVSVLRKTAVRSITLITCYPFDYVGRAPERLIVRGRQIAP